MLMVGQACSRELLVAYPDETIGEALRRMGGRDVGRLPVVSRDNPHRLLGMLRRSDLVRAYDIALTRRAAIRHRAHQIRLGAVSGVEVEEVVIGPATGCVGRRVGEVAWPREAVIATIRRGRQVLIPHGDTILKAGDVLVVVADSSARRELHRVMAQPGKEAG
jgi:CIC family chloride channel protein